jgi:hypothetical protein
MRRRLRKTNQETTRVKKIVPILPLLVGLAAPGTAWAVSAKVATYAKAAILRAEQVGTVVSATVSATTYGASQMALNPEFSAGERYSSEDERGLDTNVDLVTLHGSFIDTDVPIPDGEEPPSGNVLTYTLNASTGEVMEMSVGNKVPEAGVLVMSQTMSPEAVKASRARIAKRRRLKARAATWGSHCSTGENHHCYAITEWDMGSSEYVEGAAALVYTNSMNVPYEEKGDFVTNEQWVNFPHHRWVEMGTIGGREEGSCCTLHAFKAEKSAEVGEFRYASLGTASFDQWIAYSMESNSAGNWCFYIGYKKEIGEACSAVMERYSKDLQAGEEAADETTPENSGEVETAAIFGNGDAYNWNYAEDFLDNDEGEVGYNGLCVAQYAPYNHPGNIYFGNYGSCP